MQIVSYSSSLYTVFHSVIFNSVFTTKNQLAKININYVLDIHSACPQGFTLEEMPDSNLEITAYRKPVVLYPLYAYQYFCPYTVSTVYCRIFFSLYILEICVNPFPPPEPGSFPIHSSSDLLRGHPESTLTSMSVLVVNL